MSGPTRHRYSSAGLALNCWEWGRPNDRPSIVLLHGGLEHGRAWDGIAAALAGEWHILAPDLRGHGDSDWAPGSDYPIMAFVADLAAMFAQLEVGPAFLVGHSLGGAAAVHFSALFPEKVAALCVIEGLRPATKQTPNEPEAKLTLLREWVEKHVAAPRAARIYPSIDAGAERIAENDPRIGNELARDLAKNGMRQAGGGFVWKYDARVRSAAILDELTPEPSEFWKRIACPVLLVYGAQSWAKSPAEDGRMANFADARLATIPDAGHNVHHHQPEAFCTLLRAFFDEADTSPRG